MTAGSPVMSADLQSALIDIALWLYRGFFLPGDQLLSKLPGLYHASHGRIVSGLLSAVIWVCAIGLMIAVWRLLRDLDRALAAYVVRLYEELRRAVRVVARRAGIAFRAYALERQARLTRTEVSELPALSGVQLEVLQSHLTLPPGHLLTPNDIANALEMRLFEVERALGALRKLSLVERTFGAGDGEDGYRLTRAGQVFLSACSGAQTVRGTRIEPRLGSL
jgi:DNA-binding MarR family transcriptional regulator